MGDFEHLILLALVRLGEDAYGASIQREIEERTGRDLAVGAIYTALGRLERGGYVSSRVGEPTPERGGRRRKHYRLEPRGEEAVSRSQRELRGMTEGLERPLASLARRQGAAAGRGRRS